MGSCYWAWSPDVPLTDSWTTYTTPTSIPTIAPSAPTALPSADPGSAFPTEFPTLVPTTEVPIITGIISLTGWYKYQASIGLSSAIYLPSGLETFVDGLPIIDWIQCGCARYSWGNADHTLVNDVYGHPIIYLVATVQPSISPTSASLKPTALISPTIVPVISTSNKPALGGSSALPTPAFTKLASVTPSANSASPLLSTRSTLSPSAPSSACQVATFAQCAGTVNDAPFGPCSCPTGYQCTFYSQFYSQCIPTNWNPVPTSAPSKISPTAVPVTLFPSVASSFAKPSAAPTTTTSSLLPSALTSSPSAVTNKPTLSTANPTISTTTNPSVASSTKPVVAPTPYPSTVPSIPAATTKPITTTSTLNPSVKSPSISPSTVIAGTTKPIVPPSTTTSPSNVPLKLSSGISTVMPSVQTQTKTVPPTTAATSCQVAAYGQCGGIINNVQFGPCGCPTGFRCVVSSQYYSQCLPQ